MIQKYADNHKVSPAQILLKFLQYIGVTPLISTTNEEHMRQNLALNFKLNESEIIELSKISGESETIMSIYSKLQSGEYMLPHTVLEKILLEDISSLESAINDLSPHIPNISPNSLAGIIASKGAEAIPLLKDKGADLSKLGNHAFKIIIESQGEEFFDAIIDHINPPVEKLLLASSILNNSEYFYHFIKESNFHELSEYDIIQIIKARPSSLKCFKNAGVSKEILLTASSYFEDVKDFNELLDEMSLENLTNYQIREIILNTGIEVTDSLVDKGANLSKLSIQDVDIYIKKYGCIS